MLELIRRLENVPLSGEARIRLSLIKGLAVCFERQDGIPALVRRPHLVAGLSERIDEILEDAYLLEASRIRTFFSPGANWAALRRDLRRVLAWVARNRSWARDAVRPGEQLFCASPATLDS